MPQEQQLLLPIMGFLSLITGLAWMVFNHQHDKVQNTIQRTKALSDTTIRLAKDASIKMQSFEDLRVFWATYARTITSSKIPPSPELQRVLFPYQPDEHRSMADKKAEEARRTAIALWYTLGLLEKREAQYELKTAIFTLYREERKPEDGLQKELGRPPPGLPPVK